jgi:hypothetical protein
MRWPQLAWSRWKAGRRRGQKLVELCRSGVSDPKRLERIWFSQRLQQIDEPVFLQLIEVQLADTHPDLWSNAVHIFHTYYLGTGAERVVPEQETFRLLTWPAFSCPASDLAHIMLLTPS